MSTRGRHHTLIGRVSSAVAVLVCASMLLAAGCSEKLPTGEDVAAVRPRAVVERNTPAPVPAVEATPAAPAPARPVIAWQPSHQDDTGSNWHEYVVCGEIVDRAIALMPEYTHVKAWELDLGLTGSNNYRPAPSNTEAFDSELTQANAGQAKVFVSVHTDGGAPSGILGECMPGDEASRRLCETLVTALCAQTGLPNRGVREVRLYSLEPERNTAPLRVLLEVGDNASDRQYLLSQDGQQAIAAGIVAGLESGLPEDY